MIDETQENALISTSRILCVSKTPPDDAFICCSSFEERCLGSLRRFDNYKVRESFLFTYSGKNEERDKRLPEIKQRLSEIGKLKEIIVDESNPIPSTKSFIVHILRCLAGQEKSTITIDVSTFTKLHLLLLLKALDSEGLLDSIRLLYTEPKDYITDLFQPLSFGLRDISTIPTFSNCCDPAKDVLLAIFLGYEGDRAMGLFENVDPHRCILIVPKPAFHPEWEGRTEKMNTTIIRALGKKSIRYADSRNPIKVARQLDSILSEPEYSRTKYNHFIAPLGTKPQTIGIYFYTTLYPNEVSLIYAAPASHNSKFYSTGIGSTWILPCRKSMLKAT
jgi:hypothetical protein